MSSLIINGVLNCANWGAELKIVELKLVPSGQSPADIRASLQAVAKMAVVDYSETKCI